MSWAERQARQAEARGDHERAAYYWSIKAEVDKAPPLTLSQVAQLRVLLRPAPTVEVPAPLRAAA